MILRFLLLFFIPVVTKLSPDSFLSSFFSLRLFSVIRFLYFVPFFACLCSSQVPFVSVLVFLFVHFFPLLVYAALRFLALCIPCLSFNCIFLVFYYSSLLPSSIISCSLPFSHLSQLSTYVISFLHFYTNHSLLLFPSPS